MSGIAILGGEAIRAVLAGEPERAAYYAEVMGLEIAEGRLEVGPDAAEALALARRVMAGFGQVPAPVQRARLGSLRVAAASEVRASAALPAELRSGTGEAQLTGRQQSHAGFFGLEVLDLRHRRFDGRMSPVLRREVFVSGDAVTVLPYDPTRDRVLVIEQFRAGPLGRGDPLPWQIEAIAGRIDPGETPPEAARREAVEEAGLELGTLEKVAEYYPSPGAVAEYLYSYVALCDLPDGVAGVFGAEAEGEDIRGILLSLDALVAAIAGGEVANAPLILTALWLQRERLRLQVQGGNSRKWP